jgi:hypothetical protein
MGKFWAPVNVDSDWLRARYLEDRWSAQRIADELGITRPHAVRLLAVAGVPMRTRGFPIDIEDLVRRYQAGATLTELGRAHGITRQRVALRLRRSGVAMRSDTARPVQLNDGAWLRRRYVDDGVPFAVIAAELGCVPETVRKALVRHGIARRLTS